LKLKNVFEAKLTEKQQLQISFLVENLIFMPTPRKPPNEPKPMIFCRCSDPMAGRNEIGRKG
jgi:hypothetical protein